MTAGRFWHATATVEQDNCGFTASAGGATLRAVRFRLVSLLVAPLAASACSSDGGSDAPVQLDASPVDVGFMEPADTGLAADTGVGDPDTGLGTADAGAGCEYPAFVSPMTEGEAIAPWSWATALDGMGVSRGLAMRDVFCNTDDDMDWSPFDLLLFISIPAW